MQTIMLSRPYSDCSHGACSREDCLADCELAQAEGACGCRDPFVTELCGGAAAAADEQAGRRPRVSRDEMDECDFEGITCLLSSNGVYTH